jgi:hypothetical protein
MGLSRLFAFLSVAYFAVGSLVTSAHGARDRNPYDRQEFVILVGGPSLHSWERYRRAGDQHDRYWGNFMSSARIRTEQLRKAHGDQAKITWLVYQRGYVQRGREDGIDHVQTITQRSKQLNVRLVWYEEAKQVIAYLNRGMNRRKIKIATFDFFGHSNKFCFLLDYSNEVLGASRCYIHQRDLRKIRRNIFVKAPRITSYGCHTGESMCSFWHRATGTRMRGALGKTDYSDILSSGGSLPVLSSAHGRWVE